MSQCVSAVRQTVFDARLQVARYGAHQLVAEVAPDHVAAQRQWESRLLVPPLAHVRPEVQPAVRERELTLVNEESCVGLSGGDELFDLIECDDDMARRGLIESEREKGGRELPGNGDQASDQCFARVGGRSLTG